jgi:hypothetical protein
MKFTVFLLLLSLLSSCGPGQAKNIFLGLTTKKELKQEQGEPLKIEQVSSGKKEILIYPEDVKYQVEDEIVVAKFRTPQTDEEKSLIYWRQKFKNKKLTVSEIKVEKQSHLKPEQEMIWAEMGVTVVYDPNIDLVVRIFEYEAKK